MDLLERKLFTSTMSQRSTNYNHPIWYSPVAKIVAKKLQPSLKKLTHDQALEFLASKAGKTVEEFLDMGPKESWRALGFVYNKYGLDRAYDPLSRQYAFTFHGYMRNPRRLYHICPEFE
jgi:hypothetical protein